MKSIMLFLALTLLTGLAVFEKAEAGVIDSPFAIDPLPTEYVTDLTLLPLWTGLPGPINVTAVGSGPTIVHRELNPNVNSNGFDAIDTEIVSMDLTGTGGGFNVQIRAGEGNGFFSSLGRSGGEIQEQDNTMQNLDMDNPLFESIFDVFFDIWVDVNNDNVSDVGEVVRNFDQGLRMGFLLSEIPPEGGDLYTGLGWVDVNDPNIGMFGATVNQGPIDLFVVNADGSKGALHAQANPAGISHLVTPEPSTVLLLGIGLAGLAGAEVRRRRKKKAVDKR